MSIMRPSGPTIRDESIESNDIKNGTVAEIDLAQALKDKINKVLYTNDINLEQFLAEDHFYGTSTLMEALEFIDNNKANIAGTTMTGLLNAQGGLMIETRTSDPLNPSVGRIWLRTDL